MKRVAEIAKKHDILIISDEIYGSYSYQEPFESMISIEGMKERSIIINSFSKDFTMTGWRVGNNIAPDYIIKVMQQINENVFNAGFFQIDKINIENRFLIIIWIEIFLFEKKEISFGISSNSNIRGETAKSLPKSKNKP